MSLLLSNLLDLIAMFAKVALTCKHHGWLLWTALHGGLFGSHVLPQLKSRVSLFSDIYNLALRQFLFME